MIIGAAMLLFADGPQRYTGILFLLMPLIMLVMGFIFTAIACLIYNWLASLVGGIEFELIDVE